MKEVSVVVVTYNPSYSKLFYTLQSIIWQENIDFEVVIADDGSCDFDKEKIEGWFKSKGFRDYKFVINPINRGTMKNAISGWRIAEGKYIKQLSPGDMLYEKNTLKKSVQYIEQHKLGLAFGLAASYQFANADIKLINLYNPWDLKPYYANDREWIQFNYLVKRDYVNGMAYIARKDLLLHYSGLLEEKVKYAEDCTYILMIADDVLVGFIQDYIIWYEYGSGISTSKNQTWSQRICSDNIACFKVIGQLKPKYKWISKLIITPADKKAKRLLKRIANKVHIAVFAHQVKGTDSNIHVPEFCPEIRYLKEIMI